MSLTKKQPPKCLAQSHDRSDLNSASTRRLPIEADHISVVQRGLLKMVKRSRSRSAVEVGNRGDRGIGGA